MSDFENVELVRLVLTRATTAGKASLDAVCDDELSRAFEETERFLRAQSLAGEAGDREGWEQCLEALQFLQAWQEWRQAVRVYQEHQR